MHSQVKHFQQIRKVQLTKFNPNSSSSSGSRLGTIFGVRSACTIPWECGVRRLFPLIYIYNLYIFLNVKKNKKNKGLPDLNITLQQLLACFLSLSVFLSFSFFCLYFLVCVCLWFLYLFLFGLVWFDGWLDVKHQITYLLVLFFCCFLFVCFLKN